MAKRAYEMKVVILVDDEERQQLIETARRVYQAGGGESRITDDQSEDYIPPEEAINSVDDALMELVLNHLEFENAGVEVNEMSCIAEEGAPEFIDSFSAAEAPAPSGPDDETGAEDDSGLDDTDELDEFETGVYLCRWPNGDFSVVTASSRREAIIALDEWAGAHPSYVHPIESFMADFGLTSDGNIELHTFAEETDALIWQTCYPVLQDVFASDEATDDSGEVRAEAIHRVRDAVEQERKRLWDNQPTDEPATEMGKDIAKQMGTSAIVADHYVKIRARRILKSKLGETGKPN